MLRVAKFSQFDGAQFLILRFIVTTILSETHDKFYSLTQDISNVLSVSSVHLRITYAIFDFELQETNRTNILRKLWCARLQIGVESTKGEEGTFTHPPAFFLPLVFENSKQRFIEYSSVTF